MKILDGLQNLVANLGTARDKSSATTYVEDVFSAQDLLSAYRASSIAKSIVDYPAEDACREWREWQADAEQITKLEAEESRLGLIAAVLSARKRARLFGGAAIYIGTGDSDPAKPLNPSRVQKGGLQYITVLDRRELGVQDIQMDPSVPGYGLPKSYQLVGGSGQVVDIHPSRLVIFRGEEVPDNSLAQSIHGWGDSVLQSAMEKIKHLDSTAANIASLVFEAKIDVIKIKDFSLNLQQGGETYERQVLQRFGLAMAGKGINGTLALDAEEEYQQKSASFSTLPDILDRFMQIVSAASGIPMTRLFGMSPGGMNATGESDLRNYYDQVKQEQTLSIGPAMAVLDECLIRSALGDRPADLHYNWRALWQLGEKEQAEVADTLATAAGKIAQYVPEEAIGDALVNALTDLGAFPGLDAATAKYFEPETDEGDDL